MIMLTYKLGVYTETGEMETLATCRTKAEAKEAYARLHQHYNCTIWVQKVELLDASSL